MSYAGLTGSVTDSATYEPIPFAVVTAQLNGVEAGGNTTDLDGRFTVGPLMPGTYVVRAEYTGYESAEVRNVVVDDNKTTTVDISLVGTSVR